jgi:hypothetical protein
MDILALLTTAREAGFETGTIAAIALIAFKLRKDVKTEVGKHVDKVVDAIKDHNQRIGTLEVGLEDLKKRFHNDANK